MRNSNFLGLILVLFCVNFIFGQSNQYPSSGDVTIRNYSPNLILQRNTDEGGFTAGIQTKMLNGTDNWYFGALHTDSWIVSKGNYANPKLTVFSSGNVGIGTAADVDNGYKLQIKGTIYSTERLTTVSAGTFFSFRSTVQGNNYGIFSRQTDGTPFCYMGDANGSASGGGTINDFAINAAIGELFLNAASSTRFYTSGIERMRMDNVGNLGIGTTNPTSKLTVAGNINSREVKVTVDAGADFVFENGYNLRSLESVDKFIKENKHLPEVASAEEMKKNGINLSEMNIKLLQKIEELTLYMIDQNRRMDKIESENKDLKKELNSIKK